MNLLDRLWRIIPVLVMGFLFACEEPNEIGDVLNPGENKIDVLYKELTLPARTVFIDSVRTDNSSRLLVGKFIDPVFGETTATSYARFGITNFPLIIRNKAENNFIIDSAFVQLSTSYFHSDDSLQGHDLRLHTIGDTLFNNVFYLSDFTTPHNNDNIGSINSHVYDSSEDSIRIPLNDSFVVDFLEFIEETADSRILFTESITVDQDTILVPFDTLYNINAAKVNDFFKGIAIEAGANNSALFGFNLDDPLSRIGIYYRYQNQTDTLALEISSPQNNISFYSLETNRSGTPLTIIDKSESLVDSIPSINSELYLQSGTGIHPRFDLQPYKDFLTSIENVVINRADIELSFTDSNSDFKYLEQPQDLRFFFYSGGRNINVTGFLANSITSSLIMTNASYLTLSPDPLRAIFNETENVYSADATIFSQFIESGDINTDEIIVIPSDVSNMSRAIFDANSVKMKIFYTIPK